MSKKSLIAMILFSLMLIISSLYVINMLDPGEKPKATAEITNIPTGAVMVNQEFKLVTQDGKDFTYEDLKGKYSLLYFGFSYCPDVCPVVLQKLSEVEKSMDKADLDSKVQFIFVSVDPSRDSIETLKAFVSQFSDEVIGLTGEKEQIDKLVDSLKGYYAKVDNKDDSNNYYVDHSSFIYLLDPQANLVSQFTSAATVEDISESLKNRVSK